MCSRISGGLAVLLWTLIVAPVDAATDAVTDDGERVRLYDDFTWQYLESEETPTVVEITLRVVSKTNQQGSCVLGLKLKNDAPYRIVSLVPQFSALVKGDVPFDNVFVSFQNVRPTLTQYQEIKFKQVACEDITRVKMHGGDRCNMSDLTKYSPEKGECLKRIDIEPSHLIEISK